MSEEKERFVATFEFDSEEARDLFLSWVSNSGEQTFFDVQEYNLEEEDQVVEFDYWSLNLDGDGEPAFGPRVHAKSGS